MTPWGLARGGGSVWQCIQPSSINHVLNNCRLVVSQLFNQGLSLEALLGVHFWDKPNFHPNLVIQTHFALDSPPGMAESHNGLGWKGLQQPFHFEPPAMGRNTLQQNRVLEMTCLELIWEPC